MNNTGEMNIFSVPGKPKTETQTKRKHNDLTYDEAFKKTL